LAIKIAIVEETGWSSNFFRERYCLLLNYYEEPSLTLGVRAPHCVIEKLQCGGFPHFVLEGA
jgi:hypothetical protein